MFLFKFFRRVHEWVFLQERTLKGFIFISDANSYQTLSSLGFTHFKVNNVQILGGSDGRYTNWIE